MAITRADFPLPDTADERLAPYFAAAARGQLLVPRCGECAAWCWYPRDRCTTCGGTAFSWSPVSGNGALFSWAVVRRAFLPAFVDKVPFVTGLVALDEDASVRIVTTIVDVDPSELIAEQRMRVVFRPLSFSTVPDRSVVVPMFGPA
jgi:uncharacterized OB-fold protein